ncbi:MAG TPA: phosphoribosylglycinamide formyltransferase [Gammaproteobacteria bacterium]|nr:phosphoribosylglycinamide formyltransferase [Gammaproteobacteria bacterium]
MPGSGTFTIVVLISGSGTNLQALIDAVRAGRLPARIAAVISNRPGAWGLERARRAGIDAVALDHTRYASRERFDAALQDTIDRYEPDLVVLAGFMRILTDPFVARYAGRMINIHPSLLPSHRGLHTHQRALEAGDRMHGVSVHYVTPELDGGPVIAQARVPVLPDDHADALARRVQLREHRLYPEVVGWIARGRLRLEDGVPVLDGRPLRRPLILDDQSEALP